MTWIEIRAQDVWLFRDGKPFSGGEDHSASGMFPPTPLTVQGALRQKISMSLGVSLRDYKAGETPNARKAIDYIGTHGALKDMGAFSIRGPFIGKQTDRGILPLLPAPADLFGDKSGENFHISQPEEAISSDLPGFQFLQVKADYENLPRHWITADAFTSYLSGKLPDKDSIFSSREIYDTEDRFGVSTNAYTSFREEGLLYQVQFVRPQDDIRLIVQVSDAIPSNLLEGMMTIGGEQRQAHVSVVQNVTMPPQPETVHGDFKVIFLTPAYFSDGWKPAHDNWLEVFGGEVTLQSAALYKPLKIGGWDNAKGTARRMHNYVAPGSVYYFKAEENITLPPALTQNPNDAMDAVRLGFGQYAIGQWQSTDRKR